MKTSFRILLKGRKWTSCAALAAAAFLAQTAIADVATAVDVSLPERQQIDVPEPAQNNVHALRVFTARSPGGFLFGASGAATLPSGAGSDMLTDAVGTTDFDFGAGAGVPGAMEAQRITNFADGRDRIRLTSGYRFEDLLIRDDGSGNAVIFDTVSNQYVAVIDNTSAASLSADDFRFSGQ